MGPKFLAHYPYKIGHLDPNWNVFDACDEQTRLIHYTNLNTQPWKYPNHPYGELWFSHFREAMAKGTVTAEDIELSMERAYARLDLLDGNFKAPPVLPKLDQAIRIACEEGDQERGLPT